MSCVLRVGGADFAVDRFLTGSPFKPVTVFRKGEPRLPSKPDGKKRGLSGFNLVASEADFPFLEAQIADAIHFLENNQMELARLIAFPGVGEVSLDFGIAERPVAAQAERFPPTLLGLLANLGIWLEFTLYPNQGSKVPDERSPGGGVNC